MTKVEVKGSGRRDAGPRGPVATHLEAGPNTTLWRARHSGAPVWPWAGDHGYSAHPIRQLGSSWGITNLGGLLRAVSGVRHRKVLQRR